MKFEPVRIDEQIADVAPHAGAWIEISMDGRRGASAIVAPHAGAWIEIATAGRVGR